MNQMDTTYRTIIRVILISLIVSTIITCIAYYTILLDYVAVFPAIASTYIKIPSKKLTKHFLYLTQVRECLKDTHMRNDSLLSGKDFDVIVLSYRKICNKTHPKHIKYITENNTTWTTGRNVLYRYVRNHPYYVYQDYTYYIFIDGDIDIVNNNHITNTNEYSNELRWIVSRLVSPWRKFEEFLLSYLPAIGTLENQVEIGRILNAAKRPVEPYQSQLNYDAQCNAYHRDVLHSMLPYNDTWEERTRYASQQVNICKAYFKYNGHVVLFLPLYCLNEEHTAYPHEFVPFPVICAEELAKSPARMIQSKWYKHMVNGIPKSLCPKVYGFVAPPRTKIKAYAYFEGIFNETSSP